MVTVVYNHEPAAASPPAVPCLVFLYGPPGVGKLTVARELALRTGMGVAHNHLTVDIGLAVFGSDSLARHDMLVELRQAIAVESIRRRVSLITTVAYSGRCDEAWLARMVDAVEGLGGRVCFVRLAAAATTLRQRVTAPHRATMGKIHDPGGLDEWLDGHDSAAFVPYPGISLDTDEGTAAESAEKIMSAHGVPPTIGQGRPQAPSGGAAPPVLRPDAVALVTARQVRDWDDLARAVDGAVDGVWSVDAADHARWIARAARAVGPTPTRLVDQGLVRGGVYAALLEAAGVTLVHPDGEPAVRAHTTARYAATVRRILAPDTRRLLTSDRPG